MDAVSITGPQWAKLPFLTMGVMGLQIVWSVEMAYASPYLLSLGLSPALMSLVFIAGPLSGLVVQPWIGSLSDRWTSSLGRRRPFILYGTLICVFGMALLGFTRQFANLFTSEFSSANDLLTIWLATLSIFIIDFSINAVQAMDRAIIVDTLPSDQQEVGNAWASRMIGIGHVLGFFIGNINLTSLPFLLVFGDTQLKIFSVLTSIILIFTHLVTVFTVKEATLGEAPSANYPDAVNAFSEIYSGIKSLHPQIRQICLIQFFAWLSWFPLLFFSSVYVGDMYKRFHVYQPTDLNEDATIHGARAMLFNSILALITSLVLPWFVADKIVRSSSSGSWPRIPRIRLVTLWAISHLVFALSMLLSFAPEDDWKTGTTMVTLTGFSFAITEWAPFALIAKTLLNVSTRSQDGVENENIGRRHSDSLRVRPFEQVDASTPLLGAPRYEQDSDEYGEPKTGLILGIHNIFIVTPQFVMTGISSFVFAITSPSNRGSDHGVVENVGGPDRGKAGLPIIYRIAGISALIAFFLTRRLSKQLLD